MRIAPWMKRVFIFLLLAAMVAMAIFTYQRRGGTSSEKISMRIQQAVEPSGTGEMEIYTGTKVEKVLMMIRGIKTPSDVTVVTEKMSEFDANAEGPDFVAVEKALVAKMVSLVEIGEHEKMWDFREKGVFASTSNLFAISLLKTGKLSATEKDLAIAAELTAQCNCKHGLFHAKEAKGAIFAKILNSDRALDPSSINTIFDNMSLDEDDRNAFFARM